MTLDELRDRWTQEEPRYRGFLEVIKGILKDECRRAGIYSQIDGRTKELASLLKKQLRKPYDDPWKQMGDKAGARVIVLFEDVIPAVEALVERRFIASPPDRKAKGLESNEIGYSGIHYQVQLRDEDLVGANVEFAGLEAELQIHTKAQNVWSDLSHKLAYKGPVALPPDAERWVTYIGGMVAVIDKMAVDIRKMVTTLEGYPEHTALMELENRYFQYTGREFDSQLSLEILHKLRGLLQEDVIERFGPRMDQFLAQHGDKLRFVMQKFEDDPSAPLLLYQPEAILLYERLVRDPYGLTDTWEQTDLPIELLERFAAAFGRPLVH
jgi:ppGpp synthetase/RelA/SpoT-type nucleotidyltranferase